MTTEHDARDAQETVSAEDIAGEIWDSVMPPGTMDRGEAVALVATAIRTHAEQARAEERERCAQIASDRAEHYQWSPNTDRFLAVQGIAQAIRQRSEAPDDR